MAKFKIGVGMKYLVITQSSTILPYVIEVDSSSLESAVAQAIPTKDVDRTLRPNLVIDLESGKAVRPFRDGDGWGFSDTAYEKNLGILTPDNYFSETGTQEIAE